MILYVLCLLRPQGEMTSSIDSFLGRLNMGDDVTFHCHPYDKVRGEGGCLGVTGE